MQLLIGWINISFMIFRIVSNIIHVCILLYIGFRHLGVHVWGQSFVFWHFLYLYRELCFFISVARFEEKYVTSFTIAAASLFPCALKLILAAKLSSSKLACLVRWRTFFFFTDSLLLVNDFLRRPRVDYGIGNTENVILPSSHVLY